MIKDFKRVTPEDFAIHHTLSTHSRRAALHAYMEAQRNQSYLMHCMINREGGGSGIAQAVANEERNAEYCRIASRLIRKQKPQA